MTFGIIKSIYYREKMYQTLKMTDPDTQNYLILKSNLATYNRILKVVLDSKKPLLCGLLD